MLIDWPFAIVPHISPVVKQIRTPYHSTESDDTGQDNIGQDSMQQRTAEERVHEQRKEM
jgi:hypothetical protein